MISALDVYDLRGEIYRKPWAIRSLGLILGREQQLLQMSVILHPLQALSPDSALDTTGFHSSSLSPLHTLRNTPHLKYLSSHCTLYTLPSPAHKYYTHNSPLRLPSQIPQDFGPRFSSSSCRLFPPKPSHDTRGIFPCSYDSRFSRVEYPRVVLFVLNAMPCLGGGQHWS